jgi:hypothetical protein
LLRDTLFPSTTLYTCSAHPSSSLPSPPLILPPITGYHSQIFTPINIVGDDGSTKPVGFVSGFIDWAKLLADTVPSFVGEMDVVIEAGGGVGGPPVTFTFMFQKGAPVFMGSGDLHDSQYSSKKKSGTLYQPSLIGIKQSSSYTISFYPRKAFYKPYQSHNLIYFAVGMLYTSFNAILLLYYCLLIIFSYIYLSYCLLIPSSP